MINKNIMEYNSLMFKTKKLLIIFMLIPVCIVIMLISGCSEFDTIRNDRLECHPDKSPVCIGWNKGIVLDEEEILNLN